MKITINVMKRHLYITAILLAVSLGTLLVIAFSTTGIGGNPAQVGHSVDEIDWSMPVTMQDKLVVNKGITSSAKISAPVYEITDPSGDTSTAAIVGGKLRTIQNRYGSSDTSCIEVDMSKTTCFKKGSYCTLVVITDYNGNDDVRILRTQVAASDDDKPNPANILHMRHTSGGEAHLRWDSAQEFELGWSRAFARNHQCADNTVLPWGQLSFKVADNHKATIYWEGPGK